MISRFHNTEVAKRNDKDAETVKPICVWDCNVAMIGVDLKDQKLLPYLLGEKRGSKWHIKFFKKLVNVI